MGNNAQGQNRFYWIYLVGFFLILFLPLLSLPPWLSPPDWGKTIIFRSIVSVLLFLFIYQILFKNTPVQISTIVEIWTKLKSRGFWIFWLLIALLGIYFLATILSLDVGFSLWGSPTRSGGFINFAFLVIFAILISLILSKKDWQKIWNISVFVGILVSLIAIFQQYGLLGQFLITYETRPPSTIGGPIFLAIYLLLLAFLALSFGLKEKKLFWKIFYSLSFLLFIFVAIFITGTRAAMAGLVLGLLYFLIFYPFQRKKIGSILKIITLICFVLIVSCLYYINVQTRLPEFIQKNKILANTVNRLSIDNILNNPRISAWKVGWEALKERPILGYGPENFSIGFDQFYNPVLPNISQIFGGIGSGWWDRAHNFIFDIGVSAGIPALLIYLALFGVLFWQLQRLKSATKNTDNNTDKAPIIAHGIQATFIAYLVANFFSFDTFSTCLIFFLLLAYSLRLISDQSASDLKPPKFRDRNKWRAPIIMVLGVALVWFLWGYNIKPFQINTQINVAGYQGENNDCQGAIERMEKLSDTHTFLDGYLGLKYANVIRKCLALDDPEGAYLLSERVIKVLKENTKIRPTYTRTWMMLGVSTNYILEKDLENPDIPQEKIENLKKESDLYFGKAHDLNPKRQEILIEWIKTDILKKDYKLAKEKAQQCVLLDPKLGDCYWTAGIIEAYLENQAEAEKNFKIAKEKGYSADSEMPLLQLAKVYVEIQNYQSLAGVYQKLIDLQPNDPRYHAKLAAVCKEIGDFKRARYEAEVVLKLEPGMKEEVEAFLKTLPPE